MDATGNRTGEPVRCSLCAEKDARIRELKFTVGYERAVARIAEIDELKRKVQEKDKLIAQYRETVARQASNR